MNGAATSIAEEVGSRWKSYPAYKDSGVEWLGEIPEHWQNIRLKTLVNLINDKTDDSIDDLQYIGLENIESQTGRIIESVSDLIAEGVANLFKSSDILFGKLRPYLAKVLMPSFDGRCTAELLVLRPERIHQGFLFHYCLSDSFIKIVDSSTYGAKMPRASWDFIGNMPILLPPPPEQHVIAAFLDRETTHINTLIAKKERLIELLAEKRSALISHAVTKGLDPTVSMKDSGVEWLGEIPAHWKVKRNKAIFREHNLRSVSGEEELLTVSHITGVTRRSEKTVTMIEAESHEDYKLCASGDLVINTMWCWMGALGIAWESGMVSPSYNVYRPIESNLCARYVDYLCRISVYVSELTRYSKGVWKSRLRLYPEEFLLICTPLPDLDEQRTIAAFLDRETAQINALITKVRQHIEKLKEYRTALISAAVTGKIDVREESMNGHLRT